MERKSMMRLLQSAGYAAAAIGAVACIMTLEGRQSPVLAQAKDKIRIAAQVWFPSFPQYAAIELGIYAKWGLDPSIKVFPSGAPIVQAAATNEWDVAHIGLPPTVQGVKLGLIIAGAISEEAIIQEMIGRPDYVAAVEKDPSKLKGAKIFITTASTGHYMIEGCLKKRGIAMSDVQVLPSEQQASLSAFIAGNGDLAQLWPPQTTAARERGNKKLCDGVEAGLKIPSVWVIHPEFAKKNPDAAVRWLRATLDAVAWARGNKEEAAALYKKWDQFRGTQTPDSFLKEEVALATDLWPMEQQLKAMKTEGGKPPYINEAIEGIAQFYIRIGRMKEVSPAIFKMIDTSWIDKAAALPGR
jgi:NitT/TauT family transport system substrate-binding protein